MLNIKYIFHFFIIILFSIKYIFSEDSLIIQNWKRKSNLSLLENQTFEDFITTGTCQSIYNRCSFIPSYPRPRAYHTAIYYKTYSQSESNDMCPHNLCGPFCYSESENCSITYEYPGYPIPEENGNLSDFIGPSSSNCPNSCCNSSNEYCIRLINNAGIETYPDHEIMLIFGGLVLNNINLTIDDNNYNVNTDCERVLNYINNLNLTDYSSDTYLNVLYLINNCGYEMTNELWIYNINLNKWNYLKPYVNMESNVQQKPYPRFGHSMVYVEQIEPSVFGKNIKRKYIYIYGGYSLYCEHSCDDMWIYEIPFAPQRYYPDESYFTEGQTNNLWNRGNLWTQINIESTENSPGKRVHSYMVVDSNFEYIYLFGGMSLDENEKNTLLNDLWRFSISSKIWEQLNTLGILNVYRNIMYWDGTNITVSIEEKDYKKESDLIEYTLQIKKDDTNKGKFPCARAGHTLTYITLNSDTYIILYGGYTWSEVNIYNFQSQLNDMWVYNINENSWKQAFPNSEHNPSVRFGHCIVNIDVNKLLLYGGCNSEKVLNDLWLFNTDNNMWIKLEKDKNSYEIENWPFPAKSFSLITFSEGIILYGGAVWKINDDDFYNYTNYSNSHEIINENTFNFLDNLWILYNNSCERNCSNNGYCHYNRCICNENYWGDDCSNLFCYNSFCYIDFDIFSNQKCFHCSGHGKCLSNGKCECNKGYLGDDCGILDCLNNCSGEGNGECIVMMPQSQCNCNQTNKRGGDDCSVIFCLNDCGKGECNYNEGVCNCEEGYFGEDCSLYIIDFRLGEFTLKVNWIFFIFFIIILFY